MTKRVCFYGGPGIGKSTLAAQTFVALKKRGEKVELVQEWVKTWAWEKYSLSPFDQLYSFAKQLRTEERLLKQRVSLITDSPLAMQLVYAKLTNPDLVFPLQTLCRSFEKNYPGQHFFLARSHAYDPEGRYQNEAEARKLDDAIEVWFRMTYGYFKDIHYVEEKDLPTILEML